MVESMIQTGVDRLVSLVNSREKVSFKNAANALSVGIDVIEEWAEFLEEEGIISKEYKFTIPYLVRREMTEKEIDEKVKDFKVKKGMIIRKAETMLFAIDGESKCLKKLREEFDKFKEDMKGDSGSLKVSLDETGEYKKFKENMEKQMLRDQQDFREKLESIGKEVARKIESYERQMIDMQKKLLDKSTKKGLSNKNAVGRFKGFFDKKIKVKKLIDNLDKDRDNIKKELLLLVNEAKVFELGLKSGKFKKHSVELEKKLKEIDKKKGGFEEALRKLGDLIKK